jgi:glutaconate CoA-transferase subunit B
VPSLHQNTRIEPEHADSERQLPVLYADPTFLFQQRGYVDYAFIGAAQIDKYGNVNTTVIGPYEAPKPRLPGSGGANDLISCASKAIVVTMHEKRPFVEKVDFITSPGFLSGKRTREQSGLILGGVHKVVTDLAILGLDDEERDGSRSCPSRRNR